MEKACVSPLEHGRSGIDVRFNMLLDGLTILSILQKVGTRSLPNMAFKVSEQVVCLMEPVYNLMFIAPNQ